MATKKNIPKEEKLDRQDLDLFEVLSALDKKDYSYYDKLSEEQKRKFVPFIMTHWMSAIKANEGLARYYVMSTNEYANKYLFNEFVGKHPKLQWLMLCSASPGLGKQFHQWIPHIKEKVVKYKENANVKDIKDYYTKIYPKANDTDIQEIAKTYVSDQKRKVHLSQLFPNMKIADIDALNNIVTDQDIEQYEKDRGNN